MRLALADRPRNRRTSRGWLPQFFVVMGGRLWFYGQSASSLHGRPRGTSRDVSVVVSEAGQARCQGLAAGVRRLAAGVRRSALGVRGGRLSRSRSR